MCHVLSCQFVLTPPILLPVYWLIFPSCSPSLPSSFAPFIISLCLQSCASSSSFHPECILFLPCRALPCPAPSRPVPSPAPPPTLTKTVSFTNKYGHEFVLNLHAYATFYRCVHAKSLSSGKCAVHKTSSCTMKQTQFTELSLACCTCTVIQRNLAVWANTAFLTLSLYIMK